MSVYGQSVKDYCRGAVTMLNTMHRNNLVSDEHARLLAEGFVTTLTDAAVAHGLDLEDLEMTEAFSQFDHLLMIGADR